MVTKSGELKRIVEGITPKMLTQTPKELEADELISRKVYVEVPPKVEYTLTVTFTTLHLCSQASLCVNHLSNEANKSYAAKEMRKKFLPE